MKTAVRAHEAPDGRVLHVTQAMRPPSSPTANVVMSGLPGFVPPSSPTAIVVKTSGLLPGFFPRRCGLVFAGIDIKRTPAGEWVFLELNSSPIYLDVEHKLGHPISRAIAELIVGRRPLG